MSNELKALMEIDRDYLLPAEVAPVMHWDTHALRLQAREDPSKLGFPVLVYGSRVKIPKIPFLQFMGVLYHKEED